MHAFFYFIFTLLFWKIFVWPFGCNEFTSKIFRTLLWRPSGSMIRFIGSNPTMSRTIWICKITLAFILGPSYEVLTSIKNYLFLQIYAMDRTWPYTLPYPYGIHTRATTQPPKPPPVILAPYTPGAPRMMSTSWSSSGHETSISWLKESCDW